MAEIEQLRLDLLGCVENSLLQLTESIEDMDLIISRLESAVSAIEEMTTLYTISWASLVITKLEAVTELLLDPGMQQLTPLRGRPKIIIPFEKLEFFLSMNFNVQQISKMFGVSTSTIFRNLRQNNFTVSYLLLFFNTFSLFLILKNWVT